MPTVAPAHEYDDQTLLGALTHRTCSDLVSSVNTVSAAAPRTDNPTVKPAFAAAHGATGRRNKCACRHCRRALP